MPAPINSTVIDPPGDADLANPPQPRGIPTPLRGWTIGLAAGAVFYLLYALGVLANWIGLAVLVLLALALPIARTLSRRILFVGMLSFGWIVIAYRWPLVSRY